MQTQPSVFKAYDIRGIYGQDFDETLAYDLGLASILSGVVKSYLLIAYQ